MVKMQEERERIHKKDSLEDMLTASLEVGIFAFEVIPIDMTT